MLHRKYFQTQKLENQAGTLQFFSQRTEAGSFLPCVKKATHASLALQNTFWNNRNIEFG
jgi:hypothetical protein